MNLFELFVKIGVDDQASGKIQSITQGLGNGLRTAAKVGVAAVGAAAAGITAFTTMAVNNFAEYEQLVGGVDTLFKEASQRLQTYAANAYATAGMSANDYMANATAFSASLISALGGDTELAAEYANRAMVSMSDNANKMGTSIDSIVATYQSLSRGNFAMLDNLKLGYGGTRAELERLIADAASYTDIQEQMGITVDASSMSFANIVNAIAVVQGKLGVAGATALEAGTTIEGSANSMKAAWQNLVTGIADDEADLEMLIDNFVTTVVGDGTENNLGFLGNILPAVKTALNGAAKLVSGILPEIMNEAPSIIQENLPVLANAAVSIIESLLDGLDQNSDMIAATAIDTIVFLADKLLSMLPEIIQVGLDLVVSLARGISDSLPTLIPTIVDVILEIVDILTDPENLENLLTAALTIVTELAWGLVDAIPQLAQAVSDLIIGLADFLVDPKNIAMILRAALDIVIAIGTGILNAIPVMLKHMLKFWDAIIDNFRDVDWQQLGRDLVQGFKNGIAKAWGSLKTWFRNLFGDLVGIAKRILGIASPSKVFKELGGFTAEGFGIGWEDEFAHVRDDIERSMAFDGMSVNASVKHSGVSLADGMSGGTSYGDINVTVNGAKYTDEHSLATAVAEAIQNMSDRRRAVYA